MVNETFERGESQFHLDFLPAELDDSEVLGKPSAQQKATLKLGVPSCAKPDLGVESFLMGTPEARLLCLDHGVMEQRFL